MENNTNRTKAIVEAGIITAIIVVLGLINAYLDVFSFIGMFIMPIPITILYLRHNIKVTLTSILSSAIIVSMLYQPLAAISSAIIYGLIGIALGYCIKKQLKMSRILLIMTVVSLLTTVVNLSFYAFIMTKAGFMGIIKQELDIWHQTIDSAKQMSATMGQSTAVYDLFKKVITDHYIMLIIPTSIIMGCFASGYLNYVIAKKVLKKLRYDIKENSSFKCFYINNRMLAALVIIGLIGSILSIKKIPAGEYITNTALMIGQYACVLDAIALVTCYLSDKFKLRKALIVLIIIFTVVNPLTINMYMFLGLADAILDFRKLDPNRLFKNLNKF